MEHAGGDLDAAVISSASIGPSGTVFATRPFNGLNEKLVMGFPAPEGAEEVSPDLNAPESDDARVLVRLLMPESVSAAFDEALDLHRAVEGRDVTVTSFVEALVGEAAAGGDLPEPIDGAAGELLEPTFPEAEAERALARSTNRWEQLSSSGSADWALRLAGSSLEKMRALNAGAGKGDAVALDTQVRDLVALEDEIESRLGALLAEMADDRAWIRLRFASAVHYAEERLGLRRTAARARVRLARALRRHPILRDAYEKGEIGAEAAAGILRSIGASKLDDAAERAWLERAKEATVKRLRDEARLALRQRSGIIEAEIGGCEIGRDADIESPTIESPTTDESGAASRSAPSHSQLPIDDAAWYASLRREVGTARRRVAALGRLAAERRGSDVFHRSRLPAQLARDFLACIESARVRLARRASEIDWDQPWPEHDPPGSLLAAREFFIRCRRTPAWVGLLALLEEFVSTWDVDAAPARRSGQKIFIRDGWRCAAPGCTSRRNLEEHHVRYRSRGGDDSEPNRVTLCRFHHQLGQHGGLARVRGRAPLGLLWNLGRHGAGGWFRNERKVAMATA